MELTTSNLASVHTAVYSARARWYNIGLQLGLEASTLDSIQSQFSGQPDSLGDCLRETLKRWLQRGPRLQSLLDALRNPTVGEERLALELERSNIQESEERTLAHRPLRGLPRRKRTSAGKRILSTGMRLLQFVLSPGCVLLFLALLFSYYNPPEESHGRNIKFHSQPKAASSSHFELPSQSVIKFLDERAKKNHSSSAESNLPHLSGPFIGRESDVHDITSLLIHSGYLKVGIVGIYGPPAVGKSTLVIHVGHRMVKHGFAVRYINLNDVHLFRAQPDSYSSHYHTTNSHKVGTGVSVYPEETALLVKWFSPIKHKYVTQTPQELVEWAKGITKHTLLILDNCDDVLEENESLKNEFQKVILAIHQSSSFLKVMITSRLQVAFIADFKAYKLKELDLPSAVELLQAESSLLNANDSQTIAELVGNNPLALRIAANIVNQIRRPTKVINELKQNPVETLSPESLPQTQQIFHIIDISYKHLDVGSQRCGHDLSFFPGSFSENAGLHILQLCNFNWPHKCLKRLVTRSLLELYTLPDDTDGHQRFQFHRLIQEFFKYYHNFYTLCLSEVNEYNARLNKFTSAFQAHYSMELSSYAFDDEFPHEIEYDSHNFLELLKQIANKPVFSPEVLLNLSHVFIESSILTDLFTSAEVVLPIQRVLIGVGDNLDVIVEEIGIQKTLVLYTSLVSKVTQCMITAKVSGDICRQLCEEVVKAVSRIDVKETNLHNISILQYVYYRSMSSLFSHSSIFCIFECKESRQLLVSTLLTLYLSSFILPFIILILEELGNIPQKWQVDYSVSLYLSLYLPFTAGLTLLLVFTEIYVLFDAIVELLLNGYCFFVVGFCGVFSLYVCGFKWTMSVLKKITILTVGLVVFSYLDVLDPVTNFAIILAFLHMLDPIVGVIQLHGYEDIVPLSICTIPFGLTVLLVYHIFAKFVTIHDHFIR